MVMPVRVFQAFIVLASEEDLVVEALVAALDVDLVVDASGAALDVPGDEGGSFFTLLRLMSA